MSQVASRRRFRFASLRAERSAQAKRYAKLSRTFKIIITSKKPSIKRNHNHDKFPICHETREQRSHHRKPVRHQSRALYLVPSTACSRCGPRRHNISCSCCRSSRYNRWNTGELRCVPYASLCASRI